MDPHAPSAGARSARAATAPAAAAAIPAAADPYARGVVYVLLAALSFGMLGTLSNLAYRAGMSSPMFTVLRAAIGALALAALIAVTRRPTIAVRRLPRPERVSLAIAIVANATLNLALFAAYGAMPVALVLAVYFTYPILVALASVALGRERFTAARVVGLALATIGLFLVLGSQVGPEAGLTAAGLAFAALAAGCQATYLVVSRAGYTRVPSDQATMLILTGGVLLALPLALVAGPPGGASSAGAATADLGPVLDALAGAFRWIGDPTAWLAAILAGTVAAAAAKVWLLRGVRRIGGTRTAVLMLAEPLFGVVLAAVFLGQAIVPVEVAGGALVLLAALLVQRPAAGPAIAAGVRGDAGAIAQDERQPSAGPPGP
jgi:drug/metabolite transporter (DMT)-like permease